MKFISTLVTLAIAFLVAVLLGLYSIWAWSHVFDWYLQNYLSKYFEWAVNMPLKSIEALFLFGSTIFMVWFDTKDVLSDLKKEDSKEEDMDKAISTFGTLLIILFVAPWFTQMMIWIQVSWFNL